MLRTTCKKCKAVNSVIEVREGFTCSNVYYVVDGDVIKDKCLMTAPFPTGKCEVACKCGHQWNMNTGDAFSEENMRAIAE